MAFLCFALIRSLSNVSLKSLEKSQRSEGWIFLCLQVKRDHTDQEQVGVFLPFLREEGDPSFETLQFLRLSKNI
jgi:hypothetical protein